MAEFTAIDTTEGPAGTDSKFIDNESENNNTATAATSVDTSTSISDNTSTSTTGDASTSATGSNANDTRVVTKGEDRSVEVRQRCRTCQLLHYPSQMCWDICARCEGRHHRQSLCKGPRLLEHHSTQSEAYYMQPQYHVAPPFLPTPTVSPYFGYAPIMPPQPFFHGGQVWQGWIYAPPLPYYHGSQGSQGWGGNLYTDPGRQEYVPKEDWKSSAGLGRGTAARKREANVTPLAPIALDVEKPRIRNGKRHKKEREKRKMEKAELARLRVENSHLKSTPTNVHEVAGEGSEGDQVASTCRIKREDAPYAGAEEIQRVRVKVEE